jgi:integrase
MSPVAKRGNGEGSIYWVEARKRFAGGYVDVDGKRKVVYGRTRQEANKKLTAALGLREHGVPAPSQTLALGTYLEQWLEDTIRPGRRPGTYLRYANAVHHHINPVIGKIKLARIGPEHIQHLQRACLDKGLGKASIELVRATLSGALTQAMRWGLVLRNPVPLVEPPYGEERPHQALSPEQATTFLHAIRGHEFEQLYTLMLATGLRIGEALGLRWQDVDLNRRRLQVCQQLTVLPRQPLSFTAPKSKSGRRTIALAGVAVTALEVQRARIQAYTVRGVADLVFADELGRPLVGRDVERKFKDVLKLAGLPATLTPHSLRHSAATYLMAAGTPPKVIMELMGHSSLAMTAAYQHVMDASLDDAAERLDSVLGRVAAH